MGEAYRVVFVDYCRVLAKTDLLKMFVMSSIAPPRQSSSLRGICAIPFSLASRCGFGGPVLFSAQQPGLAIHVLLFPREVALNSVVHLGSCATQPVSITGLFLTNGDYQYFCKRVAAGRSECSLPILFNSGGGQCTRFKHVRALAKIHPAPATFAFLSNVRLFLATRAYSRARTSSEYYIG